MGEEKKVWLVRAGRRGEDEEADLTEGRAMIGFRDANNLASYPDVAAVARALLKADKEPNENRAANRARQAWAFSRTAQVGDSVVLPLKTRPGQIALGRIVGPYEYTKIGGEKRHTLKVKWLKPDVPRSAFKQDLLYSFGAFMTVCRIQRNDAEHRVAEVLAGKPDPGFTDQEDAAGAKVKVKIATDKDATIDLAQAAQDELVAHVRKQFQTHDLARLVGAVLEAEGYVAHVSPPGPDGGADILAGRGPLGLDSPTLCVQVKATDAAADVKIFRELVGTMDHFKADQGLLVCWGGFTQPLKKEAQQKAFKVKMWDQTDLVNAVYRAYDKLSPEIQAELPLKRVWMLVREDIEEG
ncbi:MAG: restriction endonuclease [Burkholderiales bacterium]|nr:restriction endonuclease [Burkholderiales bacterium]